MRRPSRRRRRPDGDDRENQARGEGQFGEPVRTRALEKAGRTQRTFLRKCGWRPRSCTGGMLRVPSHWSCDMFCEQ